MAKKVFKFFWLHLVPGTNIEKNKKGGKHAEVVEVKPESQTVLEKVGKSHKILNKIKIKIKKFL